MPPGTPLGFLVAKLFCEQGTECDIPLAQRLMEEWRPHAGRRAEARPSCPRRASVHDDADRDTALVQQFLDVPVVEREAVIQPDRVLDDGHRETVAVRFQVSHGKSAYPDLVKANALTA